MFPPPAHEVVADRLAEEFLAEIAAMGRRAMERIDRGIAFFNRSQAQKRRFERYRRLLARHGDDTQ